ncbi:hypothetical protein RO3G_03082 [Rhizopus delemar RA 99-880]|uniref:Uncharacterized protein n=1 Tax=Rhizopus delemar (strain RA 99-880 / ATCC MYA-4621 / FGSC 9543 / NRRL 43880) TaxID=246409 RepID=I1BQ98_RHIO9|nr:hypothetical protein RO3G_03082 [Rhizopus delemar RA 99-880]|eukprot:EIE78378.1 hypothetical protein RO3G_03082 [Rhizopus delemar RA 99-880]
MIQSTIIAIEFNITSSNPTNALPFICCDTTKRELVSYNTSSTFEEAVTKGIIQSWFRDLPCVFATCYLHCTINRFDSGAARRTDIIWC